MNKHIAGFPKVSPRTYEDWLFVMDGWHHLVIVFNEAMLPAVYFDGKVPMRMSDGAIYDRVLTPDEVAGHFAATEETKYQDAVRAADPVYYSGDDPEFTGLPRTLVPPDSPYIIAVREDDPVVTLQLDEVCPICHKVIINDAHGGPHPSPGDHDPGEHVLAAYGKIS